MKTKVIAEVLKRGNNNLDLVRLLAAIMVIWSHAYALNNPKKYAEPFGELTGTHTMGTVAVDIFFFISGVLVTNSLLTKKNIIEFISARLFRILPALAFVCTLLAIVIGPAVSSLSAADYFANPSWHNYITNNIMMNTQFELAGVFTENPYPASVNGSIWTIRYEVICYLALLSLFICWIPRNKYIGTFICIIIIIDPLSGFLKNYIPIFNSLHISIMFSCFATGSLFAIHKTIIRISIWTPAILLSIYYIIKNVKPELANLTLSIFVCITAFYLSATPFFNKLHIRHDISYGVYLWGFITQQLIVFYLSIDILSSQILATIISLVMGYISARMIELPAMKLHRKVLSHHLLVHYSNRTPE